MTYCADCKTSLAVIWTNDVPLCLNCDQARDKAAPPARKASQMEHEYGPVADTYRKAR